MRNMAIGFLSLYIECVKSINAYKIVSLKTFVRISVVAVIKSLFFRIVGDCVRAVVVHVTSVFAIG